MILVKYLANFLVLGGALGMVEVTDKAIITFLIILINFLTYSESTLIRIAKVCHDASFICNRQRLPTVFIGSLFSAVS